MGIYCIQDILVTRIPPLNFTNESLNVASFFVVVFMISYILTLFIHKNKVLNLLMFGGR